MMRPFAGILLLLIALTTYGQAPTGALVAYYPFNNQAVDHSDKGNDGNIIGDVQPCADRFGNNCGALKFNGTDGYISVPNSQSLQSLASSMSVAVWFKLEKGNSKLNEARVMLFSKGSSSTAAGEKPGYHVQYVQSFGEAKATFRLSNDLTGEDKDYGSHRLEYGQWYFFAVVYDENWVQAYLNGKVIWQGIYNKSVQGNDFAMDIGKDALGGARFFSGCMDDFRIYSRGLSAAEVAALYKDESSKTSGSDLTVKVPQDKEQTTDPGKCNATVTFIGPTAAISCGKAELKQIAGPQSGSVFNQGLNNIIYEVTTDGGKKQLASFNITVVDKEAPVLQCPNNIMAIAPVNATGIKVDYPVITATDNCPNAKTNLTLGPASGTVFKMGTTTVKYAATDASGNKSECTFKVTVDEEINPIPRCTQDIVAYTSPTSNEATITYTEPYIDIKGQKIPMALKMGGAPGTTFGVGRTIVSYDSPTSQYGDIVCNFSVTVKDTIRPAITCNKDIRVMCDEVGQTSKVVTYTIPTATDAGVPVTAKLVEGLQSGAEFLVGATKVIYEAVDASGNKSICSFKVIVDAKPEPPAKPTLHCTQDITVYTEADAKDLPVDYTAPYVELKSEKIRMTIKSGLPPGSKFAVGKNAVTYAATRADLADLSCSFTITVKDTIAPVITCGNDLTRTADPVSKTSIVTYTAPTATDGGAAVTARLTAGIKSGEKFPVGVTEVKYEATDFSGNKSTCGFKVIVELKEIPPLPHCTKDITVYTKATSADAIVTYTEPYIEHNGEKKPMQLKSGLASGSAFTVGKTAVSYAALIGDASMGCNFTVTVKDTIAPTLSCPREMHVVTAPGQTSTAVSYDEPTAFDGGRAVAANLVAGLKSGEQFPIGETEVKYEAADLSGNKKTCGFKVVVTAGKVEAGKEAPVGSPVPFCPKDITAYVALGSNEASVAYEEPYVDFKGKKLSMALKSGGLPGSKFAVGKTTVTYALVNSDAGDIKCSFNITVKDTIAPLISCNNDVKATCDAWQTTAVVEYPTPIAADAGQNITPVLISGLKSGDNFPIGITKVTYEATDASGNKRTCSFKVTVESKPAVVKEPVKEPVKAPVKKEEPVIAKEPEKKEPEVKKEEPVKAEPVAETKKEPEPAKPAPVVETKKPEPATSKTTTSKSKTADKAPEFVCPADIIKTSNPGKCGVNVEYNAPKPRGQNVTVVQVKGLAPGSFFPTGNTLNTFRVTEPNGSMKECSFNVKVADNVKPTISCPADTVIMLSHNRKGVIYNYDEPVATDDCKMDSTARVAGSKTGCFLPVGVHPFIFDASDMSGNKARCSFTVTVKADEREELITVPKKLNKLLNMGADSIHYEHNGDVQNCLLTVIIYDDGEEDGDSVSIVFDDVVIVNREKIRIKENGYIKKQIVLIGGQDNFLIAKAWNTGRTGLNTLKIDIYEGAIENDKRELKTKTPVISKVMHSRPGDASGIVLRCSW